MEDQANINDLRSYCVAKIKKVLLGQVSEEECALQATVDGYGVLLGSVKNSLPIVDLG